jgi:PhzF family phenazine biosynthesis protein
VQPLAFRQVDVFTRVPFKGNPVAVVLDGDGLSDETMQAVARWTNLSETTFVCRPTDTSADYRLRIFTPRRELPFAGHPTIGSAHAVLRHGLEPRTPGRLVQECAKGLIELTIDGDTLLLALPDATFREPTAAQLAAVADGLGLTTGDVKAAAIIDVGPIWFTAQLASGTIVRELGPDLRKLAAAEAIGAHGVTIFGLCAPGTGSDVEVRSFAPSDGIPEDPVCGSGNGCVAALIRRERALAHSSYVASQGRCLGRDGRVAVRFGDDGTIWLGGHAVTCVEGVLHV